MFASQTLFNVLISLLPVLVFLAALVLLDSFKLVRLRSIVGTIVVGCAAALICYVINTSFLELAIWSGDIHARYVAPAVEETLKALYVIYLIKSKKVGFMVDGAIYGFAVGAGFALVENLYYLRSSGDANMLLWVFRGLGTAIMHGGTTAVFSIIAAKLSDKRATIKAQDALLGLGIAIAIHSLYNHFFFTPAFSPLMVMILVPFVIVMVFEQSEKTTRQWLGIGLDTDLQLLDMIITGNIVETKLGEYFQSLRSNFRGEIIADMLCLIRIHVELSIRAKGILLMRSGGYNPPIEASVREKFAELRYLRKSIGKTGQLAIAPFLHTSSRDLWQIYLLEKA